MLDYYSDSKEEQAVREWAESKLRGISKFFHGKRVLFSKGDTKEVFLVSEELYEVFKKIKKKELPFSVGFFFAEIGDEIRFSLETLQEYAKMTDFHKVIINRKYEQKFLHGRNINNQVIRSYDISLKPDDIVVVANALNEGLGMGKVVGDFKSSTKVMVVDTKKDLGMYLRRKE